MIGDVAVERQLRRQPGVSALYSVDDVDDDCDGAVALHVLPFLADRPASHHRLSKAVDIRDRLGCDGLVPAIAVGHAAQGSWIELELPDGCTLRELLSLSGPLSVPRSLAILRPVAAALDAGHSQGLVCDSLTPDSVLVSGVPDLDERGHLIEIGPVWPADVRPGRLLGDPSGLAPEEIRGAPPSRAANVYALAALLVRCLTGEPPFPAATRAGVLSSHLSAPPPRLSERVAELPAALDALIASALAKDPRERPASAGELIDRAGRSLRGVAAPRSPAPAAPPAPVSIAAVEADGPLDMPRPTAARPARDPKVFRAVRRVAIIVPAVSLTVLAVFAALHSDPVKRTPAPPRAAVSQKPKAAVNTVTLTAVQDSGGRPRPAGHLSISAGADQPELTMSATGLPPESSHPRQAYAVWLFNSRHDAARLGFVVPPVGTSGRFESHRELPVNAGRYHELVVTLESVARPRPEGPIYLRGELPAAALTESSSRDSAR